MKTLKYMLVAGSLSLMMLVNADEAKSYKQGVVNTKKCLENSKLGKQEQANFEKMKVQMETVLHEKEKALEDIESKLNDEEYLDSISSEAEGELKRKRRTLRQDAMQLQSQYMQTLQQANYKIIQNLSETISKASEKVAKNKNYDLIINDEATSYYNKSLDISDDVIVQMNAIFDAEQKEPAKKS